MSLIASEQDDPAVLRAEDEAIAEADKPKTEERTALDALAEILNDRDTPEVHPQDEAGSGSRG